MDNKDRQIYALTRLIGTHRELITAGTLDPENSPEMFKQCLYSAKKDIEHIASIYGIDLDYYGEDNQDDFDEMLLNFQKESLAKALLHVSDEIVEAILIVPFDREILARMLKLAISGLFYLSTQFLNEDIFNEEDSNKLPAKIDNN